MCLAFLLPCRRRLKGPLPGARYPLKASISVHRTKMVPVGTMDPVSLIHGNIVILLEIDTLYATFFRRKLRKESHIFRLYAVLSSMLCRLAKPPFPALSLRNARHRISQCPPRMASDYTRSRPTASVNVQGNHLT